MKMSLSIIIFTILSSISSSDDFYQQAKLDFEFSHMKPISIKKPSPQSSQYESPQIKKPSSQSLDQISDFSNP